MPSKVLYFFLHMNNWINSYIAEGTKETPNTDGGFSEEPSYLHRNSTKAKGLDNDGWLRSPQGDLIFWVPSDKRNGVQDMSLMTLPLAHPEHTVFLDCTKMVLGEEWVNVKVC